MSQCEDTKVYYWPDGVWCYANEYCEVTYRYKGDDFGTLDVSDCESEGEIDRKVDAIVL